MADLIWHWRIRWFPELLSAAFSCASSFLTSTGREEAENKEERGGDERVILIQMMFDEGCRPFSRSNSESLPSILKPCLYLSLTQVQSSGQFQALRGRQVTLRFEPIRRQESDTITSSRNAHNTQKGSNRSENHASWYLTVFSFWIIDWGAEDGTSARRSKRDGRGVPQAIIIRSLTGTSRDS